MFQTTHPVRSRTEIVYLIFSSDLVTGKQLYSQLMKQCTAKHFAQAVKMAVGVAFNVSLVDFGNGLLLGPSSRRQGSKIFFFLVASQVPSLLFTHFLLLSKYTTLFYSFTFLSFPLPFLPFLPYLLSFHFPFLPFVLPFFLSGKFEHFSCLPGSAATALLRFFLVLVDDILKNKGRFCNTIASVALVGFGSHLNPK